MQNACLVPEKLNNLLFGYDNTFFGRDRTMKTAISGPRFLFVCAGVASVGWLAPECRSAAKQPGACDFSAWYRFESPAALTRGTGPTPWPAMTRDVQWIAPGAGGSRGAVRLSGRRNNGLYLPNPAAFFGETAHAGTIALWVRSGSPVGPKPRILFDFMVSTGNTLVDGYEIVMFVQDDKLVTWPALGRRMEVRDPLQRDAWTHVALAWDSASGTALYVNGKKAAERRGAFKPTPLSRSWPGRLGCHTAGGGYAFAGDIDELRLFNRQLRDAEIASLVAFDPGALAVRAVLEKNGTVTVRNVGGRPVSLVFDQWLPTRTLSPPWYGYTPADFNLTVWCAGVTPPETLSPPAVLAPNQSVQRRLTFPADSLGPGRLRVLCGKGLAQQEIALALSRRNWFGRRTQSSPRWGLLDRRGLTVDVLRGKPLVWPVARSVSLPVRVWNDTDRRVSGRLRFTVHGGDGAERGHWTTEVHLAPGKERGLTVSFPDLHLDRTRYELHAVLSPVSGSMPSTSVLNESIFGCDGTPLKDVCTIGAAYVRNPMDDDVLTRMATDGVRVVRFGTKKDGASFRRALAAVLEHGLRVWHTPVFSYNQVCASPVKRADLRRWAAELGEGLRDNCAVVDQSMAGEGLSYPPCYCEYCTRAFREWLGRRYGSIVKLNAAWDSRYGSWDEIEQLGSPADVDMAAERLKMMQVALDLPKSNTKRWQRLFELDRPRAMDWRRWHDGVLLGWYRDFATAFHRANGGTVPLSEQPCWPNFKTHVFFPLANIADAGGMDLYLPGEMKTTLGYAAELFLNFDMNASVYGHPGKPVMVHELYVQDLSPAGLAEAQGWWLIGRGYDLMTYFTYNYYHEGTRAGLPLVFGMFDEQWKPYPVYPSFKKFVADFERLQKRFDLKSLRRPKSRVALFMGDDMSIANILETGGATWEALGVQGHNGSYWLTERGGYGVEFVNDASLTAGGRERVLVVPWSHVIRPKSVHRILDAARSGELVIIDGAFARFDDVYRPYPTVPGAGAAAVLGVQCTGFDHKVGRIVLPGGMQLVARGRPRSLVLTEKVRVLARFVDRTPAVVECPVGKGRVVWLLGALGPEHRSRAPDPNAVRFWGGLLEKTGIVPRIRFEVEDAAHRGTVPGTSDSGGAGTAAPAPLTDISVRIQDNHDVFLFVTNFFAPNRGVMEVRLPGNTFAVSELLTNVPVHPEAGFQTVRIPIDMDAFETRVYRLQCRGRRRGLRGEY